jgi:hypothetical protein
VTLADLRRLTIRKQLKVRFRLRNGMECMVTEHGIAKIAQLKETPDFNLDEELASATEFVVEPVAPPNAKNPARPRTIGREEMAGMSEAAPAAASAPSHEDD